MRQWLRLLVLAAACLAAACKEPANVNVHSISFQGVSSVDATRLREALATHQSSKLPWGKKNEFVRARLDADLKRIEAFYADRGYPDARVSGVDVKLNSAMDSADVTLTITEGQPVKVVAVRFNGFDAVPPTHLKTIGDGSPLKIGDPRDREFVSTTHALAIDELRDHGYPYAKVSIDENDGPTGKEATMTFTAEPGLLAHFGPIEIVGNMSVGKAVIERELTYEPGDLYQFSAIRQSQRLLYGMSLFQFVTIELPNAEQQPVDVPTRVTIAEGKHQRLNFGVGYGTEEKGRVDGEYHHLNFLGGARSAGVHARWSSLDRGLRLDFTQPYVFRPHFSLNTEAQQWYTYTPAYESVTSGGKLTLIHRADQQTSWSVFMATERDTSSIATSALDNVTLRNDLIALGLNPITGEQRGTLNAVGLDVSLSTADNALNATHGYQLAFHTEDAGRLLPGTFRYFAMTGDARHYLPIGRRVVIANRLQLGNITELGDGPGAIPFGKKFFLGGATSIRGWGRYEVGPLSSGLPIGGDSMLAFSSEVRAPIAGKIGGVLFLDAGNVWTDRSDFAFRDLRYAAGLGMRYETPVGAIRLDGGYQLNPIPTLLVNGKPQTRRWRVHFSIGQAF